MKNKTLMYVVGGVAVLLLARYLMNERIRKKNEEKSEAEREEVATLTAG